MFNLKPPDGSYGGGAFFVKNMSNYLINKGYKIVYSLEKNIDLIFMIDPRKGDLKINDLDDILEYRKNNINCKLIYRVNECDIKREKSINIEPLLVRAIKEADYVVFVSQWLMNYYINKYDFNSTFSENKMKNISYILNGVNQDIFNKNINLDLTKYKNPDKISLVTHHFSNNYLKGFEIYNKIDELIDRGDTRFKDITLTYIGRYHDGYKPKNINLIPPCQGNQLANEIKKHDIYLTATQNEPGAMHYLEGASCGLPVLYRTNGGGAQEICNKFGLEYKDIDELIEKIMEISLNYNEYKEKINNNYDYLSRDRCCSEFYKIINKVLK